MRQGKQLTLNLFSAHTFNHGGLPSKIDDTAKYQREYHQLLRKKVINKYGGVCIRCGFSDVRALQIDHVYGGGKKELSSNGGRSILRWALNDTSGKYQLLCANCNWIKRYINKEGMK